MVLADSLRGTAHGTGEHRPADLLRRSVFLEAGADPSHGCAGASAKRSIRAPDGRTVGATQAIGGGLQRSGDPATGEFEDPVVLVSYGDNGQDEELPF